MAITEREKHIENLKTLVAFLEVNPIFKLSDEMYKSLDYAISSLKTDLKYDLIYEGEEVYTKAHMVAMLEDIRIKASNIYPNIYTCCSFTEGIIAYDKLIQQKINELKEAADET